MEPTAFAEKTFPDVRGESQSFKECMVRIASCSYVREDRRSRLLKRLRFLVVTDNRFPLTHQNIGKDSIYSDYLPPSVWCPGRTRRLSFGHQDQDQNCPCSNFPSFCLEKTLSLYGERPTLALTPSGELANCTHFVAVSYCWKQPEQVRIKDREVQGYHIQTKTGIRPNRAPTSVLDRAISYAESRRIKAIWIDQECIEQDDPTDKEIHVQCMDTIYKAARQVVAILNFTVIDQQQVILFEQAYRPETEGRSRSPVIPRYPWLSTAETYQHKTCALTFMRAMVSESWFFRAWPFQESIVPSSPLHFLLPCKIGTLKPSWMGSMSDQVVLDQSVTHGLTKKLRPFTELAPMLDACDRLYTRGNIASGLDHISVLVDVYGRALSEEVDRIAIVANICGYKVGLSTQTIRAQNLGIDASMFVQALLNGDLSLLIALQKAGVSLKMDRALNAYSWCKLLPCKLSDLYEASRLYHDWSYSPIKPPILHPQGLACAGNLFEFRPVEFGDLLSCGLSYKDFDSPYWPKNIDRQKLDRTFWQIIEACYTVGFVEISKAIFAIAELDGWNPSVPNDIHPELRAHIQTVDLPGVLSDYCDGSQIFGSTNSLMEMVVRNRVLYVASMDQNDQNNFKLPTSIFKIQPSSPQLSSDRNYAIFVPQRDLNESEVAYDKRPERIAFWDVNILSSGDNVKRLECCGDLRMNIRGEPDESDDEMSFFGDSEILARDGCEDYLLI